jgi:hypothetical protein
MLLRFIYHLTKDGAFLGPGSMFVVASGIYLIAVYCAYSLPDEANSLRKERPFADVDMDEPSSNMPLL